MSTPNWDRVKSVFGEALKRPLHDRRLFLDGECARDQAVRGRVESLLSAHDAAGSFLGLPAVELIAALSSSDAADTGVSAQKEASLRPGTRLRQYEIQALLGAGGMGVVYRARDLALGRSAALKVLPDGFKTPLRQRLIEEAEASSHLQHPSIATFFESGTSDGTTFIAMELVEGETLRQRLSREPVAWSDAVEWTKSILEALTHAHAAGILHRDIKPENIIIAGQSAKLLDFGLAKHVLVADSETALTAAAAVPIAGTIGYMSPEQIRNEALDGRSDVFQVGAVLYETLTGRPAFPGSTPLQRLSAVLTRAPHPIDAPEVPSALVAIVMRALARDPAGRFSSAAAFLADLRDFTAGEWTGDSHRIVILDFDNGTHDPRRAWIATALADALTAELRKVPTLSIAPRDRVPLDRGPYMGESSEALAARLGLQLGCRWAVTGAFEILGGSLCVTVSLVDTATQRSILAGRVDGTLLELFDVQDRVSASVLAALNVSLVRRTMSSRRPALSAYELYARGRHLFLSRNKGSMEQACELYEQAVQLEPDYAPALSGLAGFHAMQFPFTTDSKTLHLAENFARRAIDLEPSLADAHNWLGYALWRLGSLRDAHQEWAQAIMLDESWYMPFYFAGSTAHLIAVRDNGLAHMQRAVELAPHLSSPIWGLACLHTQLGNYPEALWCFERTKIVDRASGSAAHWAGFGGFHGECLRRTGRLDEGRGVCLEALEDVERSDHMYRDSNRVVCLVTLGRIALQQRDLPAARAAYGQAIAHVHGRRRMLAGGCLVTQAFAGLAAADEGETRLDEAIRLYQQRDHFDFSWLWFCADDTTLLDLARATAALGRYDEARQLMDEAAAKGSLEARYRGVS